MLKLPFAYYRNKDVIFLSKDLLGKYLMTKIGSEEITGGMIVETEAYNGINDKASHAYSNRRTKRNEMMYAKGGVSYVYVCYGIHCLFNIVTGNVNDPQAILVRAIKPIIGFASIMRRRKKDKISYSIASGPGILCQSLGIRLKHNGIPLDGSQIWVEDRKNKIATENIIASSRVGVDYAEEDALLPWRFRIKDNPWTSKNK